MLHGLFIPVRIPTCCLTFSAFFQTEVFLLPPAWSIATWLFLHFSYGSYSCLSFPARHFTSLVKQPIPAKPFLFQSGPLTCLKIPTYSFHFLLNWNNFSYLPI